MRRVINKWLPLVRKCTPQCVVRRDRLYQSRERSGELKWQPNESSGARAHMRLTSGISDCAECQIALNTPPPALTVYIRVEHSSYVNRNGTSSCACWCVATHAGHEFLYALCVCYTHTHTSSRWMLAGWNSTFATTATNASDVVWLLKYMFGGVAIKMFRVEYRKGGGIWTRHLGFLSQTHTIGPQFEYVEYK